MLSTWPARPQQLLTFAYEDDNLGAGQSVIVQARNVTANAWETLTGGTLGSTTVNGNGTFNATLTANQIGANSAIRFLTTGDGNNWDPETTSTSTILRSMPPCRDYNAGVDAVNGGAGDDTIIWNANGPARPMAVTWSTEELKGHLGDTFVINGNASAETYRIYTVAAATAAGITGLNAATEIVITRNGTNNASVIAELTEIEEIRHQRLRSGWDRPELPGPTASRSSATSRAPACASTPSPSMAMRAMTRSTSRH